MNINLIDQQIIDSFFKHYKKDVRTIPQEEFMILKEKISQNLQNIIDLADSKEILLAEFSDYKFSFFQVVAKFGKAEELRKIINIIGINQINISDVNNYTALHHASISGRLDNIKILIGYGANINAKSSDETRNWLPIHYASKFGFKEIVEEFINAGIDKEIRTAFGLTPLAVSAEFGSLEVAQYLIAIKCDLNPETIPENQSLTPLHYATIGNFYEMVVLLIESGAQRNKKTIGGDNALILATKRNFAKICEYLLICGLEDLDIAHAIAEEKGFKELEVILKKYVIVKDKLFNNSEIARVARDLINIIVKINPQNLDQIYFELFGSIKVTGYFLCSIKKEVGFFKKHQLTLRKFAEDRGLADLSANLKNLEDTILHRELLKKY